MNPRDFLMILFKHRGKIIVTFLTIVTTVTIVSYMIPSVYEVTSTLLVKFGREYIYRPEVGDNASWASLNSEERVNAEIQILTSQDLIERVVRTIGAEPLYPVLARTLRDKGKSQEALERVAVPKFKGLLQAKGIKNSNVIQVSFQNESPQIAAKAVNVLVDFYKEKHLEVHSDPQSSFLEQQLLTYEKSLKESENKLETFKQKYQVYSLPEQRTLFLRQRTDFDTDLKKTRNDVMDMRQRLGALKTQMQSVPEDVPLSTVTDRYGIVDTVKSTLLNLQLKEQELLIKYKENNPMVVNVRKEILLAKEYLQAQEENLKKVQTTGKNTVYQELEKEMLRTQAALEGLESKASGLFSQIRQLDKEIQMFDLRDKELQRLTREHEVNEKNYRTYLDKMEEARISDDMDRRKMANVSVIAKAIVPLAPVKPRRDLYIAFSVVFGIIAGLGLAFFFEYTGQGLTTPDDVERRLGARVLIAIPHLPQHQKEKV